MAQGKHYVRLKSEVQQTIYLIGCGGTGSILLSMLHRIDYALRALGGKGIHVIAYDGDTVSEANIGRQSFYPFDVGQNKASVLISRINASLGLCWEAKPEMFSKIPYQSNAIIVTCVDSAKTRKAIAASDIGYENCNYWLDCGNTKNNGQVILGTIFREKDTRKLTHSGKKRYAPIDADDQPFLPHVVDLFPNIEDFEEDSGPSCSLAEAIQSQDLAINPTIAIHAFHVLWELLTKSVITTHGSFINLENHMSVPMAIDRDSWKGYGYKPPRRLPFKRK